MKKICIVTAARSEYGLLRWIIDALHHSSSIELQLVVTGGHLSHEQGYTVQHIENDGYPIAAKIDMRINSSTSVDIATSMSLCGEGIARAFDILKPDLLVILGDRYELLPISSSALVMGIPIAHISGGDVTEGAIDDAVRNAVTMMATYHFPGVKDSARNIERMLGSNRNIYVVGEPGLDNFNRLEFLSDKQLAEDLQLDKSKRWILMTYHSQTKISIEQNIYIVKNIISALDQTEDIQVVITAANSDFGGAQINTYLRNVAFENPDKYKFHTSLGQLRYISFLSYVSMVIGNSSSGIVEAPYFRVPVVNVGDRQNGRYLCSNVVQSQVDRASVLSSINKAWQIDRNHIADYDYYGDGHTAKKIIKYIKNIIDE